MIEELFSCAILMDVDLMSGSEYNKYLDELFMKEPTNELLLQLEYCSSNVKESVGIIYNYVKYSGIKMNHELFGKFLFHKSNKVYKSDLLSIEVFSMKMYGIWTLLPEKIKCVQPFHILSYADDCLAYGDVEQAREFYEEVFEYFEKV